MDYLLTGSRQMAGVRVFAFDGVASDRTRMEFTVSIDTGLLAKYAIALQELPLLCRQLLEKRAVRGSQTLTFTEAEMVELAAERAEILRAVQQRKLSRKVPLPHAPVNRGFSSGSKYPA